jgi:hypothetical protein
MVIHRGEYRFRLNRAENPRLGCIRAGKAAEKTEMCGLNRVGLWKQPSLGPNIRLLESCGAGGACRVARRAKVATQVSSDVKIEN